MDDKQIREGASAPGVEGGQTSVTDFLAVEAAVRDEFEGNDDRDDLILEIALGRMDGIQLKEAKRLLLAMREECVHHASQLPLWKRSHGALWFEVEAFLNPSTTSASAAPQDEAS